MIVAPELAKILTIARLVVPLTFREVPAPDTVSAEPFIVNAALIVDGAAKVSEPPEIVSGSLQFRLLMLTTVVIWITGLPAMAPITTSLVAVGTTPPLQFAALVHVTPSPPPVQVAVAASVL